MAKTKSKSSTMSPPASTGSAGSFFEQHVDAAFLALLLVRGIPPCLTDCQIVQVHFQTRHLGWNTDDLLIVGAKGNGSTRQLAAQVKRTFRISKDDAECRETIAAAWKDFRNGKLYKQDSDLLAIITLRGTERLLTHFATLLDCARASLDAADFIHRIGLPKFVHELVRTYFNEIRAIVESANGSMPNDEALWQFLKVLHLLSFDLNSPTSQTEAWIKNLLAHTADGSDKIGVAEASWNKLLAIVSAATPNAGSFQHESLPKELRKRHNSLGKREHQAIHALRDHTETVLRKISARIGGECHISRTSLSALLLAGLADKRVVVVTGQAGSGKSAVAKDGVTHLSKDYLVCAFRAEEFAAAHLDETLSRSQIPATAQTLSSILALHSKKIVLVESVERLLEKSDRDAFADFLHMVKEDESWRLILTCREYSLDSVRTAFLENAGLDSVILSVPPLEDSELDQIVLGIPKLKRPSRNSSLRKLFRNPYFLDKAARMEWKQDAHLPEDERSFRKKVWHEIIREEASPAHALPARRGATFVEIALRRARSLSPYATCVDLDQEAIHRLRQSDLVEFATESDALVAPSHDVLEDWALIQFLDEQFALQKGSHAKFLNEVGTHPALRRAFRKWLSEMLEFDPAMADAFVLTVVADSSLPEHARDDTLVSAIRSSRAADFILRNEHILLQQKADLLRRVIHLLRVACKVSPHWIPFAERLPAVFFVPAGEGWAAALKVVERNIKALSEHNITLIAAFLEDWAQGISWWTPYPAGAEDAASIAYALLPDRGEYLHHDEHKRLLKVIVKIPKAAPKRFEQLVEKVIHSQLEHWISNEVTELLLEHLDCASACRDFPELIIKLAESKWIKPKERKPEDVFHYMRREDIGEFFGLNEHLDHDFFPASSLNGPFLFLLQSNRDVGLKFIVRLLNYCSEFYANPKTRERLEPPVEIELLVQGKVRQKQWCSSRLWCLYRGTSVGPHVIQCALMALESWLLDQCKNEPDKVEGILLGLLRESNNIAVTAVVASVATAYPQYAGAAATSLLTCPAFFQLDQVRMVQDYSPLSGTTGLLARLDPEKGVYGQERETANKLPHRQLNLESLALNLQTGSLRKIIWKILDRHQAELPPVAEQSEEQKLWRLALHRMDLRQYDLQESKDKKHIVLQPKPPAPDIQEVIQSHAPEHEARNNRMALFGWGLAVFNREKNADPREWEHRLKQAQQIYASLEETANPLDDQLFFSGPAHTAAICVRDHWNELKKAEQEWCADVILRAVAKDADSKDHFFIASRNPMDASRPAALILPMLFGKDLRQEIKDRLQSGLALSLTHASEEVVDYALEGVGAHLWDTIPQTVLLCASAVVYGYQLEGQIEVEEKKKPYEKRLSRESVKARVTLEVRAFIQKGKPLKEKELFALGPDTWWGQAAIRSMLPIFRQRYADALAREFFDVVVGALVSWWKKDRHDQSGRRHYELEHLCVRRLAEFVLRIELKRATQICSPIVAVANSYPKEAAQFVEWLIITEDVLGSGEQFWTIWQSFAAEALHAPWVTKLKDADDGYNGELLNALFLNISWNEGVRHWKRLEGYARRLDDLFQSLPPNGRVLLGYLRYLYSVGERALPQAFYLISSKIQDSKSKSLLINSNTLFYLETLLRRFVYGYPVLLKSDSKMSEAVVYLLDKLVERGSSAAYRMRDDFVTPISMRKS